MTARERLDRRMRWIGGAMYAGVGLFLAGIFLGAVFGQGPLRAVSLPGFGVAFVVAMIAQFVGLRCPRCRGNLAPPLMQREWLAVDRRVCFCPFCGGKLDEKLPVEREKGTPRLRK
jgi:hypothetical protein